MISSYPNNFYGTNSCEYINANYPVSSTSVPNGTPFSVKDILNLAEEEQNFSYDPSIAFEDDQNYPIYEQSVSNFSDFFAPPSQCQFGEQFCAGFEGTRGTGQWEEAARVSSTNQSPPRAASTNHSAAAGVTSQHVHQLSHLSPPFQEVSSSDDSKK